MYFWCHWAKKSIIAWLSAYYNSSGLKEHYTSAPLENKDHDRELLVYQKSFQRVHAPIGCSILCILVTGDVAMFSLAVETGNMPYILNFVSGNLTS